PRSTSLASIVRSIVPGKGTSCGAGTGGGSGTASGALRSGVVAAAGAARLTARATARKNRGIAGFRGQAIPIATVARPTTVLPLRTGYIAAKRTRTMSKIETPRPIRGTQDIFGAEAEAFAHVVETFERVRKLYRFRRIEMPVFEK